MFLGESIETALSEVWELAMALSSLKYIAGMVRQEVESSTDLTGKGEGKNHTTKSHSHSPLIKNNATFPENMTKQENNTEKEMEPAALISSALSHTLAFKETSSEAEDTKFNTSMVAHCQAKDSSIPSWNKEESKSKAIKEEYEQTFLTSMVAHQLCNEATSEELSEVSVSMASHVVATKEMENDKDMFETNESISMIVHQVTSMENAAEREDLHQETTSGECYTTKRTSEIDEFEVENQNVEVFSPMKVEAELIPTSTEISFISSLSTHQLSSLETPIENCQQPVSMVVHGNINALCGEEIMIEVDSGITSSMVSHQVDTSEESTENITANGKNLETSKPLHPNEQEILFQFMTKNSPFKEAANMNEAANFITSMCTHQLSPLEPPTENWESQLSMAAHGCFLSRTPDEEITVETDPGMITSMVSHQLDTLDRSIENINSEETMEDNCEVEDLITDTEPIFLPSMCTHQLSTPESPSESNESQVSMAAHGYLASSFVEEIIVETDPGMITSMVSHQVDMAEESNQNFISEMTNAEDEDEVEEVSTEYIISKCSDEDNLESHELKTIKEELIVPHGAVQTSMATHQLPGCNTPTEFPENLISFVAHNSNDQECDANTESSPGISMVSHQADMAEVSTQNFISEITNAEDEDDVKEDSRKYIISKCSEEDNLESHELKTIKDELVEPEDSVQTSMATHQLPGCNTPTEFPENLISSVAHNYQEWDANTESSPGISMVAHQHHTCVLGSHMNKEEEIHIKELNKESSLSIYNVVNTENNFNIKVENNNSSYTEDNQTQKNEEELPHDNENKEEDCLNERPVGNEDEELSESFDNILSEAPNTYTDTKISTYNEKLKRIQELQKLVENEIGEFENQRKNEQRIIENNLERTETHIVNNVKGVEFESYMVIHPQIQDENEAEMEEESVSVNETISSQLDTKNDIERTETYVTNKVKGVEFQSCVIIHQQIQEEYETENKEQNYSDVETVSSQFDIENNAEISETKIVNNVKGVEFESCMVIHSQIQEENEVENEEDDYSDSESISSQCESIDSVILKTSDQSEYSCNSGSLLSTSDQTGSLENLIQASCTLEHNSPVIITTSQVQQAEELEQEQSEDIRDDMRKGDIEFQEKNSEEFDDIKKHLRKLPRKSSNVEIKIRETELLNSLFKSSSNQNGNPEEHKKGSKQDKSAKKSITLATLNENVKKQTYKIRFKVKLNQNSSQTSILQYLFGCFGGEKLFQQQQ